jgi:hypothetical protein
MNNFGDEVSQRIAGSPFQALVIMDEIFQDGAGTFTLDFDYRSGSGWDPDVRGAVTIASDMRTFESAIMANVTVMEFVNVDFTALLNRDRLAVQLPLIGRDFYGITFATFARDMTNFGNMMGMSQWEIREIIDAVEMLEQMMDVEMAVGDDWGEVYSEILADFFLGLDFDTQNTDLVRGRDSTRVNRIEFFINERDIADLMRELVRELERDEVMRNAFGANSPMAMDMGMPSWSNMMRDLNDAIRDFEQEFRGTISLALYVERNNDRLAQVAIDADMRAGVDRVTFDAVLDLGTSVYDTWWLTMSVDEGWGRETVEVSWDFRETGQGFENRITIPMGWSDMVLASTWNPGNGLFTLSVDDGWMRESFGGRFTINNDGGFSLDFDTIDLGWDTLGLGMSLSPGADIPRADFINMDRWDWELIDMIERTLSGLMMPW